MDTVTEPRAESARASEASRPKPKRYRLRNHEAWDRLKTPVMVLLGYYPGLTPKQVVLLLDAESFLDWIPRGANERSVVLGVLRRLARTNRIVATDNGWMRTEDADKDDIADHGNSTANRGLRVSINAVKTVRSHGALTSMDRKTKAASAAAEDILDH